MGRSTDSNYLPAKKLLSNLRRESKDVYDTAKKPKGNGGGAAVAEEFDSHLLNGLESDTRENRAKWFLECLQRLLASLHKENIKRVVFPYKIGCGLAGGNWERDYCPGIMSFNEVACSNHGVEVIIVKKSDRK